MLQIMCAKVTPEVKLSLAELDRYNTNIFLFKLIHNHCHAHSYLTT